MGIIVAIGGGELRLKETLVIDQKIVELSGKVQPNLLFIHTASGESEDYEEGLKATYKDLLGCQVEALYLLKKTPTYAAIQEQIDWADIIYVGGGNTRSMMNVWRDYRVDEILLQAFQEGKVLSGLSAGSICWFEAGQSDSDLVEGVETKEFSIVQGLGLLPFLHSPHFDEGNREADMEVKMMDSKLPGLCLTNGAAMVVRDHHYEVLKARTGAKAYYYPLAGHEAKTPMRIELTEGHLEDLTDMERN